MSLSVPSELGLLVLVFTEVHRGRLIGCLVLLNSGGTGAGVDEVLMAGRGRGRWWT